MPTPNRQTAPKGENHLLYSEDFTNAAWTKATCTITPNYALALDGTMTASLMTGTSNAAYVNHGPATAARVHTCNFDVQKGKNFAIALSDSSANGYVQGYNGTTGVTVGGGGVGSGWTLRRSWVEDKGTYWRVYLTVDHPQSVASMNITMNTALGNSWATIYAAAATAPGDTMVFARAQITPTDSPVPYIKTTSSTSTPSARRIVPVSQNLNTRSETLGTGYTATNLSIASYAGALPIGYSAAQTITESTDGAPTIHTLQLPVIFTTKIGTLYTLSFLVKPGTIDWIGIYDTYVGGGTIASFDLTNKLCASAGAGFGEVFEIAEGFLQCNWYYVAPAVTIAPAFIMLTGDATYSYQGNGTRNVTITGVSVAECNRRGVYRKTDATAFNIGNMSLLAPLKQNLVRNSNNITLGRTGGATVVDFKTFTLTAIAASNLTTTLVKVGQQQAGKTFTASAVLSTDSGTKTAFMCRLNTASWATATVYPVTITTTPTRFSFQFTPLSSDTVDSYFTIGGDFKNAVAPTAGTYIVEDMQVTQTDYLTPFVRSTANVFDLGTPRPRVVKGQNLLRYSELITSTWYAVQAGITSLTGQPGAPDGTSTVTINAFAVTTSYIYQTTLASLQAGTWVTFSVWLWSPTKATIGIRVSDGNAAGGAQTTVNLTSTPTRHSVSFKLLNSGSPIAGLDNRVGVAGDGIAGDVYIWGAQLENNNVAGPYVATTTTRYDIGNLRNTA